VCSTQPILGAMDSMAAHSEGYSPRCSCTMRTARSRTSGENLFDFFLMAQSSQRKEPPQNPGRFTSGFEPDTGPSRNRKPRIGLTYDWYMWALYLDTVTTYGVWYDILKRWRTCSEYTEKVTCDGVIRDL